MSAPRVLIADDEPAIRETLSFLLEMEGFAVALAADGDEALAEARRLEPPVILLDAMLPGRDGFSVCRAIKQDPRLLGVRVVMLTALAQSSDRERALAAGADEYVRKPFDDDELIALLRRLTAPLLEQV